MKTNDLQKLNNDIQHTYAYLKQSVKSFSFDFFYKIVHALNTNIDENIIKKHINFFLNQKTQKKELSKTTYIACTACRSQFLKNQEIIQKCPNCNAQINTEEDFVVYCDFFKIN